MGDLDLRHAVAVAACVLAGYTMYRAARLEDGRLTWTQVLSIGIPLAFAWYLIAYADPQPLTGTAAAFVVLGYLAALPIGWSIGRRRAIRERKITPRPVC